jgi:hypothetical protein
MRRFTEFAPAVRDPPVESQYWNTNQHCMDIVTDDQDIDDAVCRSLTVSRLPIVRSGWHKGTIERFSASSCQRHSILRHLGHLKMRQVHGCQARSVGATSVRDERGRRRSAAVGCPDRRTAQRAREGPGAMPPTTHAGSRVRALPIIRARTSPPATWRRPMGAGDALVTIDLPRDRRPLALSWKPTDGLSIRLR